MVPKILFGFKDIKWVQRFYLVSKILRDIISKSFKIFKVLKDIIWFPSPINGSPVPGEQRY